MKHFKLTRRLFLFAALALTSCAAAPGVDLSRPAIIGASAAAGVGLKTTMADAVALALELEPEAIFDGGRLMYFLDPEGTGESLVKETMAFESSAVIAVDYLFWFAYGNHGGADERLSMLARGLALLDELEVPILVSTLPDMKASIGKMLSRSMVPDEETLARLNEALSDWAAARPRVHLFDLPALMGHMKSRIPIQIAGRSWPVDAPATYIQDDQLHPTRIGMAFVVCGLLDRLKAGCELDPPALALALDELVAEREAAAAAQAASAH